MNDEMIYDYEQIIKNIRDNYIKKIYLKLQLKEQI